MTPRRMEPISNEAAPPVRRPVATRVTVSALAIGLVVGTLVAVTAVKATSSTGSEDCPTGEPPLRIVAVHILPNVMNTFIVLATLDVGLIIILEATLSFLGLGVQPPAADWGSLVRENIGALADGGVSVIAPALAIASLTIAVNLVIDNLTTRSAAARGTA